MDHSTVSITEAAPAPSETALSPPHSDHEMIRMENVHKQLGGKQILRGASLSIDRGETRVIMGRSGEGKSVLIKHICGLFQPEKGAVIVEGEEITRYSERELLPVREKIGYLFQNAALFDSLSVLENVGFPLYEEGTLTNNEIQERVHSVLGLVKLKDVEHKMPSELSGGMRKRVGLARAIIRQPKIILYDEPTTGLDPVTSDAINDLIISLAEELKVTSVMITHDMVSAFKVATKISMLFEGKMIYTDTTENTRNTDHPIIDQFINGKAEGPLTEI